MKKELKLKVPKILLKRGKKIIRKWIKEGPNMLAKLSLLDKIEI